MQITGVTGPSGRALTVTNSVATATFVGGDAGLLASPSNAGYTRVHPTVSKGDGSSVAQTNTVVSPVDNGFLNVSGTNVTGAAVTGVTLRSYDWNKDGEVDAAGAITLRGHTVAVGEVDVPSASDHTVADGVNAGIGVVNNNVYTGANSDEYVGSVTTTDYSSGQRYAVGTQKITDPLGNLSTITFNPVIVNFSRTTGVTTTGPVILP